MRKDEFISELGHRLKGIPFKEKVRFLDYYSEMILDLVDDGHTEEEAVSELENIDVIVQRILEDIPVKTLLKEKYISTEKIQDTKGKFMHNVTLPFKMCAVYLLIVCGYCFIWIPYIVSILILMTVYILIASGVAGVFGSIMNSISASIFFVGMAMIFLGASYFMNNACKKVLVKTKISSTKWNQSIKNKILK